MAPAEVPVMIGNGLASSVRAADLADVGDGFQHADLVGRARAAAGEHQGGAGGGSAGYSEGANGSWAMRRLSAEAKVGAIR